MPLSGEVQAAPPSMVARKAESTAPKMAPSRSFAWITSATGRPIASLPGRLSRLEARSPISTTMPRSSTTIWPCSKLCRISAGSTLLIADLPQSRSHTPNVTPDFGHRLMSAPYCGLKWQVKGPRVGHHPAVPARLELPQAGQRMSGTVVGRNPPEVVIGVAQVAHLLDRLPMQQVGGHQVATFARGGAEQVGGTSGEPKHHDPCERPALVAGEEDPRGPVRGHQLVHGSVIRLLGQLNAMPRRRLLPQRREGADVGALPNDESLLLGQPNVVTGLWLQRRQDVLRFRPQVDDGRVPGLHRSSPAPRCRWRPTGRQLGLDC